jgi:hypothetical protein
VELFNVTHSVWASQNFTVIVAEVVEPSGGMAVSLVGPVDGETVYEQVVSFSFLPVFSSLVENASLHVSEVSWVEHHWNVSVVQNDTVNTIVYAFSGFGAFTWNVELFNATHSVWASQNFTVIISESQPIITPELDISPQHGTITINLKSNRVIPVVVLTTSNFDASTIDPDTVLFEGAKPLRWKMKDIDGDADLDLVFYFKVRDMVDLSPSDTEAVLEGQTYDGCSILAEDSIRFHKL